MLHKSWVTQRIANRLPPWSDARDRESSVLQQLLNPVGSALEEFYKYYISETRNCFLTAANTDQLDIVNLFTLPVEYHFGRDIRNIENALYVPPKVEGIIGATVIEVQLAEDNSIDGFWYTCVPSRITDDAHSVTYADVVPTTTLALLESAVPGAIVIPNKLAVVVTGCTSFVDRSRRQPFSFLMLHGTTERGLEESEIMLIPYNGTFFTTKIWKVLDSVEYFGLTPSTGTIAIQNLPFGSQRNVDKYQLYVTPHTEKLFYHRLGSSTFGGGPAYSTEQFLTVTANSPESVYGGGDTLEVVTEVELGWDNAGTFTNVDLVDATLQPFTGRMIGIDATYLYVYDQYIDMPSYVGMKAKTPAPKMVIDVDTTHYLRGDVITMQPSWRTRTERIFKNRWSVKKPDGTVDYLDINGNVIPANDAWIVNLLSSEYAFGPFASGGLEVSKQAIEYELLQRGTYMLMLEVQYADRTTELDMLPIQAHSKTALARIALPAVLQNAFGIAFDSDQKLWFLMGGGDARRASLHTDVMLIDFETKQIYLHELYDSVTVYPSLDRT